MHFVVHALDKPDAESRRLQIIDAHRAYLEPAAAKHNLTLLLSGPLKSDDDSKMIGSFFLIDAPERAPIEAMFDEDPLAKAGVWGQRTITAVQIRTNRMSTGG